MRKRIADLESVAAQRDLFEVELRESEAQFSALVEQSTDAVLITRDGVFQFANKAVEEVYGYTANAMIGMPFLKTLAPECRDPVLRNYEDRIAGREVPRIYEAKILCKDGTVKEVEISARFILYKGRRATTAVVRDITDRKRAEEKILKRSREQAALHRVLMSTIQTLDLHKVLREIVVQVGTSVESAYTSIVVANEDGDLDIGSEYSIDLTPLHHKRWQRKTAALIVRSEKATIVDNIVIDGSTPRAFERTGIRSYAGFPIRTKNATIGVLFVHSTKEKAFAGSAELLSAFSNQAAIAIENARLYNAVIVERARVETLLGKVLTAQEDERRRLSLDIHDTVTQSIYGVLARIGAADKLVSMSSLDQAKIELSHARKVAEQTLSDLRRVATDLHPPALERLGLCQALRQHMKESSCSWGPMNCSLEVKGEPRRLLPGAEIGAYRIIQEALNNARKHSAAAKVVVRLRYGPRRLSLEVLDNGNGFQFSRRMMGRAGGGRLGLVGMIERAELLGGSLTVRTRAGSGTVIRASIPA
jgi:PAS domain S-box-containing protein